MPYDPKTPYIPFRADLSGWGHALLYMLSRNDAEKEKIKEGDSLANAYYKYLQPAEGPDGAKAANPLGDPDSWKQMSAQDRIAKMQVHSTQTALERATESQRVQDQANYANILRDTSAANANNAAMTRFAAGEQQLPAFFESLTAEPTNSVELPATPEQRLARALKAAPAVASLPGNTLGSQVLEAVERSSVRGQNPLNFEVKEDPKTGTRFATWGASMQPSGVNPDIATSTALPVPPAGLELDSVGYDKNGRAMPKYRRKPGAVSNLQKTAANGVFYDPVTGKYVHEGSPNIFSLLMPGETAGTATAPAPAAPAKGAPASGTAQYDNENAARAGGAKAGDVVYLKGIGKVRLK